MRGGAPPLITRNAGINPSCRLLTPELQALQSEGSFFIESGICLRRDIFADTDEIFFQKILDSSSPKTAPKIVMTKSLISDFLDSLASCVFRIS